MRPVDSPPQSSRRDLKTIRSLLPYLWEYRSRVLWAVGCLILAKAATVTIPLMLKGIVDQLDVARNPVLVLPIAFLIGYGAMRLASSAFSELRDAIFAKVTQRAIRRVALQVFRHLHRLALRFHHERQTGGVSRDIERGSRGISFLLTFMLFNVLPTLVEIALVAAILLVKYQTAFAVITFVTVVLYITFTLTVTEWRMKFRRTMNEMDSKANTRAIDSLLNYETVKYFGNEEYEAKRYDENLAVWEQAAVRNQTSLSFLNFVQFSIIAVGITWLMFLAAEGVVDKTLTMGDLVLINAYLLQLFIPMNFLGFVYREIKHALADMEKMFSLLEQEADVRDGTQQSLRAAIGSVPQDTVLFNDTLYYNIQYAQPDAPREAVIRAAKMAHIHDFIESLPDGYETQVGERGLKLSGGEKQRVAIARVILKNPRILIFDEATSALDSKSEQAILAELRNVATDHTTLVIAHRLSTIIDADQILVMDHGRIIERGTHQRLLAQAGVYAHMWALQQEERKKAAATPMTLTNE